MENNLNNAKSSLARGHNTTTLYTCHVGKDLTLHIRQLLGWLMLSGLSSIMFLTLFYCANNYWGIELQDARLVAAQEPNPYVLTVELIFLPAITLWALVEAALTMVRLSRHG